MQKKNQTCFAKKSQNWMTGQRPSENQNQEMGGSKTCFADIGDTFKKGIWGLRTSPRWWMWEDELIEVLSGKKPKLFCSLIVDRW